MEGGNDESLPGIYLTVTLRSGRISVLGISILCAPRPLHALPPPAAPACVCRETGCNSCTMVALAERARGGGMMVTTLRMI